MLLGYGFSILPFVVILVRYVIASLCLQIIQLWNFLEGAYMEI